MDDKITIIEGPPPTFEKVADGWAVGLSEGPVMYDLALTRLRTFNGNELLERCHHAWSEKSAMFLHYRDRLGLEQTAPIMAARYVETRDGHVLLLWVRREAVEDEEDTSGDSDDDLDSGDDASDDPGSGGIDSGPL